MKCIINNQVVLSRAPEGPTATYLGAFAESLSAKGYTAGSIHRQVFIAACFSRWLGQQGVGLRSITLDHSVRYLHYRARRLRPYDGDAAALRHLIDFLRGEGVIAGEQISTRPLTAAEHCVEAYEQYLREARALARATIINYVPFIHDFLKGRFGDGRVTLSRLTAGDVVRFVQRQASHLHRKRAKLMTTALRSFLQYVRYRGDITLDLAAAVPVVANWSMTSIPRAITADQVRQLLASIDRGTAIGRRDYALAPVSIYAAKRGDSATQIKGRRKHARETLFRDVSSIQTPSTISLLPHVLLPSHHEPVAGSLNGYSDVRPCRCFLSTLSCIVVGLLLVGDVLAQVYPVKPIRVIDGYPPGGGTDIVARTIAPKFQESQGQPWVIDNRAGAQGIIGAKLAAESPPDGYTLLMFVTNFTIHPSLYKNLPYDLTKAFVPVTQTSTVGMVLIVRPSLPAHTVQELIALAKATPGRLNFASGGYGGITHMPAELFKSMAGIRMTHIPYKGGTPALLATVGGEVDLTFASIPVAEPQVRNGRVRPLAVSTTKRSIVMREVPTIAEAGLPGYEVNNAYGVLAPAGTPREIVGKLQQEIARILNLPDIREQLLGLGAEPIGSTPEQFGEYIRTEIAKWAKVVKATGMELQSW